MSKSNASACRWAIITILTLLGSIGTLTAQQSATTNVASAFRLTAESQAKVTAAALQHPRVLALARGHKVRAIGLRAAETVKDSGHAVAESRSAELFLVNYANNKGVRVRVNTQTGEVEDVVEMKGRPQSSAEEQKEAEELIARDTKIGELLRAGSRAVGGFVVDPPGGAPAEGRYLEYHIASPDRHRIQHKVFVNLASGLLYIDARRR